MAGGCWTVLRSRSSTVIWQQSDKISAHRSSSDQQESIDNAEAECLKTQASCNQIDRACARQLQTDDLA